MRIVSVLVFAGCVILSGCGTPKQESAVEEAPKQGPSVEEQRNAAFWKEVAAVRFTEDRSHRGEPLPDAKLLDDSGQPATLASRKGKPLLVNFWAHWCVPCRAEMPTIDAMKAQRGSTLQVVAVNEDVLHPDSKSLGALAMDPSIIRLTDKHGVLGKSIAGQGLPTTVLYGSDGRELWRLLGVLDWTKPQAQKLLKEAI